MSPGGPSRTRPKRKPSAQGSGRGKPARKRAARSRSGRLAALWRAPVAWLGFERSPRKRARRPGRAQAVAARLAPLGRRVARAPVVAGVLVVAGLAGGFLWVRDSSLFAVEQVRVTGVHGPAAPRVRAALRAAAEDMTTLHVDEEGLREAVASFPQVRDLRIDPQGRHRLKIEVVEYVPVGAVAAGGQVIPVAGDGTLLRGMAARNLPRVQVDALPAGSRVAGTQALRAVAVLRSAPPGLRWRVEQVRFGARGLAASLRGGPDLYFGGPNRLSAKWRAALRVLADPEARGARYLDLRVPDRPAAGGVESPNAPDDGQDELDSGLEPADAAGDPSTEEEPALQEDSEATSQ